MTSPDTTGSSDRFNLDLAVDRNGKRPIIQINLRALTKSERQAVLSTVHRPRLRGRVLRTWKKDGLLYIRLNVLVRQSNCDSKVDSAIGVIKSELKAEFKRRQQGQSNPLRQPHRKERMTMRRHAVSSTS